MMKVEYIDHMGSDLTVVNSARVSFDKESEWETVDDTSRNHITPIKVLKESDKKLINYLANHKHTSPFRHPQATFRVSASIFVARQLVKHQVGMSWNEVSRRYVDSEPEFYAPTEWRKRAEDKKQGSSDDTVDTLVFTEPNRGGYSIPCYLFALCENEPIEGVDSCAYTYSPSKLVKQFHEDALTLYNFMLSNGVAPEQARMILPQTMMTQWYWTGSLMAWAHLCNLRCKPDAQQECQEIGDMIDKEMSRLFPISWAALRN